MTRLVGTHDRSEFVSDPLLALRRGRAVDRMLRAARGPLPRGVTRATHREMNRLDDQRQLEAARRLNGG